MINFFRIYSYICNTTNCLNYFLANSSASKLPLSNSVMANSANALTKLNNTLQNETKSNALKQESSSSSGNSSGESGNASPLESTPRLQQSITATTSIVTNTTTAKLSKGGDLDDLPLNSRIPQQLKSPVTNQQPSQNAQELSDDTELSIHTEHKIGGGKLSIYFIFT